MLLLFNSFLQCMQIDGCPRSDMMTCRKGHSEGKFHEKLYYYLAAVLSISMFWVVHIVICLYLHGFAHAPDYKHIYIRNVYLALTVIFFFLWVLQLFFMVLFFELAKVLEWIILLIGLVLQCCAEYSLYQHTPKPTKGDILNWNTNLDIHYFEVCCPPFSSHWTASQRYFLFL